MEGGQRPLSGTGRIRPLAVSKQATNEKPRPGGDNSRTGQAGDRKHEVTPESVKGNRTPRGCRAQSELTNPTGTNAEAGPLEWSGVPS